MPTIVLAAEGKRKATKEVLDAIAMMLGAKPKQAPTISKRPLTEELFDALFPGK